jgi:hypothetical protein
MDLYRSKDAKIDFQNLKLFGPRRASLNVAKAGEDPKRRLAFIIKAPVHQSIQLR